jgi:lysozyme family protein
MTFNRAIEIVLKHEGGYVSHPADPGGETNFGISKRSHPDVDIKNLTREKAIEIYHQKYWLPVYDRLPAEIAIKVFDASVNMGGKRAHGYLQAALRSVGVTVAIDGALGPKTEAAVESVNERELLAAYRSELAGHYRLVAKVRPDMDVFLEGWLRRAYS